VSDSPESKKTKKGPKTKKAYDTPEVREYGDVRALTQTGAGTAQDKIGGTGKGFMTAK
jgi:hypothetical protein